jgi:hypothetical protein
LGFPESIVTLPHLAGQADYRQWIFKLQAWLIRCGQDDFLASSKPEERLTTTTTVTIPVPVTDVNGSTYVDANGQIITRDRVVTHPALETDQAFEERCAAWTSFNSKLWSELVSCCEGEAALLVRDAGMKDGKEALARLQARFGATHVSSTITLMREMFAARQGNFPISQHCTAWRELVRRVKETGNGLNPTLETALFLQTLSPEFKSFVAFQSTKQATELSPSGDC